MESYTDFLEKKRKDFGCVGKEPGRIHNALFDYQSHIVKWAVRKGRAAIFADTGLGKTIMQCEWARQVGGRVLIFAPLAVSHQTEKEAKTILGMDAKVIRKQSEAVDGLNITNYENMHNFSPDGWDAVILDESSILKGFDGKYRRQLTEFAETIPYRLSCTATPAPNDLVELLNQAEFLGIMSGREIIALYFIQDGNTTHKWRLKGHAEKAFWQWMASWSVAIRKPSDLGYSDEKHILPPLTYHEHVTDRTDSQDGMLFALEAKTMQERRNARRTSIGERVQVLADLVAQLPDEPWLIWCDLNAEAGAAVKAIDGAVQIQGSDKHKDKIARMQGFTDGSIRVLVSKPSICGHGMNWQHCANVAFLGLSDSFESMYQATRRCWRFGQKRPVNVHIIISETEGAVRANIERKERQADKMFAEIVNHMKDAQMGRTRKEEMEYKKDIREGDGWKMMMGDCVDRIKEVEDNSIGLSVFSPPFPGMYAYTNSARDMGNVDSVQQMIDQYAYLAPELLRIVKPGRSCCVHLTQGVAFKGADGYIGIKDFRGEVIKCMESSGWVYYGEVCIDKDPQVKAIRTKDAGLLFKSLATDSSRMHMALADYVLQFRKPGDNQDAIRAGISEKYGNQDGWITPEEWIEWAAPVWYRKTEHYPGGIKETDVLPTRVAKDEKDEKHICPLQLGVIERCVKLWSAPGDTVFSPFGGIGSEGYVSLKHGRKFIGCELKESYFNVACKNLANAPVAEGKLF